MWVAELPPGEGPEDDYRRLCNELMRVMLAEQLFTFVTAAPVDEAQRRNAGGVGNEQRSRTDAPRLRPRPARRAAPTRPMRAHGVKR